MIFALIVGGLILCTTSLRGTQHEFGDLLQKDILGADGFLAWIAAIVAIGCVGYLPGMKMPSRYLLILLGVVMVVRNSGVFSQAQLALQTASGAGPAPAIAGPGTSASGSGAQGGSGGASGGADGGDSAGSAIGTIGSYTAAGATFGPYGAAAGFAVGVASEIF